MDSNRQNKKTEVKILMAAIGVYDSPKQKPANDNYGQYSLLLLSANDNEPEN